MPQINEEALNSLKVLDINNPPTKPLGYMPFPKVVYMHPKDKTQYHRAKKVHDEKELQAALKQGWRKEPHVPVLVDEPELADFEADIPVKEGK